MLIRMRSMPVGVLCLAIFLTQILAAPSVSAQTSTLSTNQKMKTFLLASAYGTLIGATVGGISLAFSSNPSNDAPNIAKGASLGLYAGMIYGYFAIRSEEQQPSATVDALKNTFYVAPEVYRGQVAGTTLNFISTPF